MRENSKRRLLANVVTVVFTLCFFLSCTVTVFAETQISTVKVAAGKNNWEQTSNPEVKADGKGYKIDPDSIKFSSNIADCDPGEEIEVTVKIVTEEGYVFKDTLKKNNFKVTNGKYKSHSYEDGNILLKFTYTVRGIAEAPDSVYWDGTTARWDKVSDKVNYTLRICKGNHRKIVTENTSSNKHNLKNYLILEEYYDENVYFEVKSVPKKAYEDYIKASDYIESDEFSDWDDIYDEYVDFDGCRPDWPYNPSYNDGWRFTNGVWQYYENGKAYNNGFKAINGKMHYFFNNGTMATGWQQISGKWYMFDHNGYMISNTWCWDRGTWYYLQGNGVMKTGWFEYKGQTYYLNSSGAMLEAWHKIDGNWYYFYPGNGAMAREAYIPSADRTFAYHMKSDGKLETGWVYQNGWRYVEHDSGSLHKGWLKADKCTYYLEPNAGVMLTGWQTIDGRQYYFWENGVLTN